MPARRRTSRTAAPRRSVASSARRPSATSASVLRVADAAGDSAKSWEAAVIAAVNASDVRRPLGVEIVRMWAKWDGERPSRFHVTVRVAYRQSLRPAR